MRLIQREEEVCIFYEKVNIEGKSLFYCVLTGLELQKSGKKCLQSIDRIDTEKLMLKSNSYPSRSEQMIRNGNVELQAREEEIRFIKMALNEEKRKQELLWKQLPNKRSLEEELVTLQIQLQQCQDRMLELEKKLEDPYDESRVRYLEGKDLPPAKLQDKVEDVRRCLFYCRFRNNMRNLLLSNLARRTIRKIKLLACISILLKCVYIFLSTVHS